ncbi:MAG: PrsW family glutamic-type intramembrane protease [Chloroflexota bacterium]
MAASLLESALLRSGVLAFLGAGLIEEFVKLVGLVLVARGLPRYVTRDGVVLGAAVGFGFAALESSGYALSALIVREGRTIVFSLGNLVSTELLRGILAPVGHGLWTAILGGTLFSSARSGHLRASWSLVRAFILVTVLHAAWDTMHLVSMFVAALLTAAPIMSQFWVILLLPPALADMLVYYAALISGLTLLSLVGMLRLRQQWASRTALPAPAINLEPETRARTDGA